MFKPREDGVHHLLAFVEKEKGLSGAAVARKLRIEPERYYKWKKLVFRIPDYRIAQIAREFKLRDKMVMDLLKNTYPQEVLDAILREEIRVDPRKEKHLYKDRKLPVEGVDYWYGSSLLKKIEKPS